MSQLANQSDLLTDTYSMTPSTSSSSKSDANTSQKKVLGIAAATMLLGGAAWAVSHKIKEQGKEHGDSSTESDTSTTTSTVVLPDDVDVAGKVTDNMTFEQAFTAARQEVGMGGVFSWHGHWYNTFEKEEWNSLSLEQRQEYTENITGEKLPVKPYGLPVHREQVAAGPTAEAEPTIIEGYLNGQRVMGLDFDQDGVIDTIVLDGADGYTYRVVDARGDDGLDTLYRYDSLSGELVEAERIVEPFVLSNDDFNQGLEASMSKEVVDSILEPDADAPVETPAPDAIETPDVHGFRDHEMDEYRASESEYLADSHEADDTYVNNGDVRDMDE
ncbi:hypothetical protein GCM10028818_06600 [Spirosoma horti]